MQESELRTCMDGRVQTPFFIFSLGFVRLCGCHVSCCWYFCWVDCIWMFGFCCSRRRRVLPQCFLAGCWRFSSPPSSATKWMKRRGLEGPCPCVRPPFLARKSPGPVSFHRACEPCSSQCSRFRMASDVPVPRSAAPLARYRMGVASAGAGFKPSKGLSFCLFLAPHNCGLVDAVCFHIAWWTKLCCRFVSKVLVPVLLELSRVPEVARLLPCNFASARPLWVVLWRLLWISNAAGLQQRVWGCLPGCCWGRLSFKIPALWFLSCVCHLLKLWR